MNTTNLKSGPLNKVETAYIAGTITATTKVNQLITQLLMKSKIIAQKAYKGLEEYGSAAAYATRR